MTTKNKFKLSKKAKSFLKDMLERAIKTAAQVAVGAIGAASLMNDVNWGMVASTVALSTIMSILTSIASLKLGDDGTASVLSTDK